MQSREKILERVRKIGEEVRKQIPLAANCFPEFQRYPVNATTEDIEQLIQREDEFDEEWGQASIEFYMQQEITAKFQEFCKEHHINPQEFSKEHQKIFTPIALETAPKIYEKIEKSKTKDNTSILFLSNLIKQNLNNYLELLCKNKPLKITNQALETKYQFSRRLEKEEQLANARMILSSQVGKQMLFYLKSNKNTSNQTKILEDLRKLNCFVWGNYFELTQCETGFCGEFRDLALWKFFSSGLIYDVEHIEAIAITYKKDNHTFLAINRDPKSDLKDPKTWGKDAILWDPWNENLALFATDFDKLPFKTDIYSTEDEWESLTFTSKDVPLRFYVSERYTNDALTDNLDFSRRRKLIMDEYQLTALDSPTYQNLSTWLYGLLEEDRPDNIHCPFEILITTCSDQLITPIFGLEKPAIAIHKDFFDLIQKGTANVNHLRVAISAALHEMKHHGFQEEKYLFDPTFYTKLDWEFIEKTKDAELFIHYLRLQYQFLKTHDYQEHRIRDNILGHFYDKEYHELTLQHRIKMVEKWLAVDSKLNADKMDLSIDHELLSCLKNLSYRDYFKDTFLKQNTSVDQLNYLTSVLPELKIELVPNEIKPEQWSRRVMEFVNLLQTHEFDLKDPMVYEAANELIDTAFQLKVPGLASIYQALIKVEIKENSERSKNPMQALGPFKKFNQLVSTVMESEWPKISEDARKLLEYWKSDLICHFDWHPSLSAGNYISEFKESHNGQYPTGEQRYFGTSLGRHVEIPNLLKFQTFFTSLLETHPDRNIAEMLLLFGCTDPVVLDLLDDETLTFALKYLAKFNLTAKSAYRRDSNHLILFKELKNRHSLQIDMFQSNRPIKEKLELFINKNIYHLYTHVNETDEDYLNFNGNATKVLLNEFLVIAKNGTQEEQQIVKDFFLDTKNPLSLYQLQHQFREFCSNDLPYESLYVQFVLKEHFAGEQFNLFSIDEKMKFYEMSSVFHGQMTLPAKEYISLFKLPYSDIDLPCFIDILNHLLQYYVTTAHPIDDILDRHLGIKSYHLFDLDTVELVSALSKIQNQRDRYGIISRFLSMVSWENVAYDFSSLSLPVLSGVIYLYRAYDAHHRFPSKNDHQQMGKAILARIQMMSIDDQYLALEALLLNPDFTLPMSDYVILRQAMELFIHATASVYGYDDGTKDYFERIKPLLKKIKKTMPDRDKNRLFSDLLTHIDAQDLISEWVENESREKYHFRYKKFADQQKNYKLAGLGAISLYFGKDASDQKQFIEFLSSPLSTQSVSQFSEYLINHHQKGELAKALGIEVINKDEVEFATYNLYHQFWGLTIEERAMVFDHLLIPPQETVTSDSEAKAYQAAFEYVAKKLFPLSSVDNSDDQFAVSMLNSYLQTAIPYQRSILLASMLVASNDAGSQVNISTGKKIALLCEHMGPAYIKLAQAIHSFPNTPESIRQDIAHVKGHANPPHRWDLWRLIKRIPEEVRQQILYVGPLLGSASYNLALDVTLKDGTGAVLILLRENAAEDSNKGFNHLKRAITHCDHPRMNTIKEPLLSILSEAQNQSLMEMDTQASQHQFKIAHQIYSQSHKTNNGLYDFKSEPSQLIHSGQGYRIITKFSGPEFNDLLTDTLESKQLKKEIAKVILKMELINLFSGDNFDSDRHGNQMRVKVAGKQVTLGLFDFGEMSLTKPTVPAIKAFSRVLYDLPNELIQNPLLNSAFESILSRNINLEKDPETVHYLIRLRKAILALFDFQKELSNEELLVVMKEVSKSPRIHAELKRPLNNLVNPAPFSYVSLLYGANKVLGVFSEIRDQVLGKRKSLEETTQANLEPK